jgi:hypothetical protein
MESMLLCNEKANSPCIQGIFLQRDALFVRDAHEIEFALVFKGRWCGEASAHIVTVKGPEEAPAAGRPLPARLRRRS